MADTRRLLAAGFLLLFVALAGCSYTPIEKPVCHACERGFEGLEDANVTADSSSLRIDIRANGSGRWTITSDLSGSGVERLRTNGTAVQQLAERAVSTPTFHDGAEYRPIHGGTVSNRTARFENGSLIIAFTVEDAARTRFGDTLLVDYLHTRGDQPRNHPLGADEVTVVGAPGTVVSNDPPGASIGDSGRTVVWTGAETRVSSHTYIAYTADGGIRGRAAAEASIAVDVVRWTGPAVVRAGTSIAVGLALFFGILWLVVYWRDDALETPWRRRPGEDPAGPLRGIATDLAIGLALVTVGAAVAIATYGTGRAWSLPLPFTAAIAVGLFLLAGWTVHRSRRTTRVLTTIVVGSPFVVAAYHVPRIPSNPFDSTAAAAVILWPVLCLLVSPTFLVGWYTERKMTDSE